MSDTTYFPDRSTDRPASTAGLRRAAEDLQHDLAATAGEAAALAAERAGRLREQARHWVDEGTRRARAALDSVRDEAHLMGDRTIGYVRNEPLKAVMVAALAGAALAGLVMLLRQSRR